MAKRFHYILRPEIVIGIAGPIGVEIEELCESLTEALSKYEYDTSLIKITDEIAELKSGAKKPSKKDFYSQMIHKMEHASAICREADDPSRLMQFAIKAIIRERATSKAPTLPLVDIEPVLDPAKIFTKFNESAEEDRKYLVKHKAAYIVRQIKRPEEVQFLRSVYGRQFFLVSAYGAKPTDGRRWKTN